MQTSPSPQGIDPANLDRSCTPCQDFYQFANGGWIEKHPLPPEFPAYGAFTVLALQNRDTLHKILQEAALANAPAGSNERKIGDFFAAAMDEEGIEKAGITPLKPLFATIDTLTELRELPAVLAALNTLGTSAFFEFGIEADLKDSSVKIAWLGQGGLGLPNRDYYLNTDEASIELRKAYIAHVTRMFELLGANAANAAANAATVMTIESALAEVSLSPADMRDPEKLYHKLQLPELAKLAPQFDWNVYFTELGATPKGLNASNPAFLEAFAKALSGWSIENIQTYLRWSVVNRYAFGLPRAFELADFDFYARTLQGTKEQLPRWQRAVKATDAVLGEALAEVYVAKTFSPEAKAQAIELVQSITHTLRDEIGSLEWMSPQTQQKAIEKLDAITLKIGYPDTWRDYSSLAITRDSYLANVIAGAQFTMRRDLEKMDKPVDRNEWAMTPPTVNAYYNPTLNEIVFPAGILQPPFFRLEGDPAVNFGGIGAVIGHELTHGFDDSGRKFDAQGNLTDWWQPEDAQSFEQRRDGIVAQFDALEPIPDVHCNGRLVAGEAIADLGGVKISYKAFTQWQAHHPRETIEGFTPEQRFFLGYAGVWASVASDEYCRYQAAVDPHPHHKFRVNATLANLPEFAEAWNCPIGPMAHPEDQRCTVW